MILTLKIFAIIFILNNIFYILNYRRLDKPFKERDKSSFLDLVYYFNRVLFIIWLILIFFTPFKIYSIIICLLILLRIPIHLLNKNISTLIFRLTPLTIISILTYLIFTN
jgi:hypothetical protein